MTKVNQADLKREIEAQDRKDSRKKFHNVSALRLMLDAAKKVKDTKSFANAFTPTSGNNSIARKLKLGLNVVRGQWVLEDGKHNPGLNRMKESIMRQVNEALDGKELIELLMQALEEGDAVRVTEYVNLMLSNKVTAALGDQRKLIAESLFDEGIAAPRQTSKQVEAEFRDVVRQLDKLKGVKSSEKKKLENRLLALDKKKALARLGLGEDLADLVKTSNLNRNDETDSPEPEDELLPNAELADLGADEDETFDEAVDAAAAKKAAAQKAFAVKHKAEFDTLAKNLGNMRGRGSKKGLRAFKRGMKEGSESEGLDTFRS